jgi:ABC-type spermidine/putrescine transport system permease subunit II
VRRRRILTAKRGFTAWALVLYAFLYLPIVVVVIFAFNKPSATSVAAYHGKNICNIQPTNIGNIAVWNGFTSCWFKEGLNDPTYIPAIKTNLRIAAEASVIATILGLAAALALARMKARWRIPFDIVVYLTLVVPEIVIAVASLIFFVQARQNFGLFPPLGSRTILLGQIVFNASLAMLIIRARFVGMGDKL